MGGGMSLHEFIAFWSETRQAPFWQIVLSILGVYLLGITHSFQVRALIWWLERWNTSVHEAGHAIAACAAGADWARPTLGTKGYSDSEYPTLKTAGYCRASKIDDGYQALFYAAGDAATGQISAEGVDRVRVEALCVDYAAQVSLVRFWIERHNFWLWWLATGVFVFGWWPVSARGKGTQRSWKEYLAEVEAAA